MIQFLKQLLLQLFPTTCLICRELGDKEACKNCLITLHSNSALIELPEISDLDNVYSFFCYKSPIKQVLHAIKFEDRKELGEDIGESLSRSSITNLPTAQIVIPVPVDSERLKRRGFNQVDLLMHPLVKARQLGEWKNCCFRSKATQALHSLSKENRKHELENAFWIDPSVMLLGKTILLVDDIVTSGATLSEIARELKKHGAKEIIGLTYAFTPLVNEGAQLLKGKI